MAAGAPHRHVFSERFLDGSVIEPCFPRPGPGTAFAAHGSFDMSARLRRALPPLIGFGLFLAALAVLRGELTTTSWQTLTRNAVGIPRWRLALALGLTGLNYLVLTGYDLLAFRSIGRALPRARIMIVSFLAYAIANNVGFAMLSGTSVRYRFYTRWGITAEELSRIVFSYSVTFWIGLLALGGLILTVGPFPGSSHGQIPINGAPLGWLLLAVCTGYIVASAMGVGPLRLRRVELPLPSARIALTQLAISMLDWALAAAVLFVLLPPSDLTWLEFLGAFLTAMLLGLASHVPGGAGVFEGLLVLLLRPHLNSADLLPAFIVYRAVYYLAPLFLALLGLIGDELLQRRSQAARVGAALGQIAQELTPRLLAAFTFLAGLVLLLSGATPAATGRLTLLARVFPLGVIETSHFAGSVIGAMLLLLSQGLSRRLDAAYYLSLFGIAAGVVAALLKGFDYEEATLLAFVFVLLWRARHAFNRRAAFFDTRFSAEWIAALAAAITASICLGLFAFKHVNYSTELWWQFELHGEASRFLRGSVGVAIVVLLFGIARLIRHTPHEFTTPADNDLADAGAIIRSQTTTMANLVFLRDKTLIFSEDRTTFVMYGVHGRTWVALGDPVGCPDRFEEVIGLFLERCDDFGGTPVFYEVSAGHLHRYADLGLTFAKLGEEAKVDLTSFTLSGGGASRLRQTMRRLEKDGGRFRVVGEAEVPQILGELREISNDWLAAKTGGEKGFSLGFFDEAYIRRFPIAVVESNGRIQAFSNIWLGGHRHELSLDLMRYRRDAPKSVMEGLLLHLLLWGQSEGYRWFALGMAPLAGVGHSPIGSPWNRIGAFLYEHGEPVYKFQGLRAFKEKFNPVWEPRYLAYPGGLKLPLILADVSVLIAGGYRQVFRTSRAALVPRVDWHPAAGPNSIQALPAVGMK